MRRPRRADVVIPAEAYAEKEGTVTHPDGRLQRLRPAVPRPDEVRPVWQVLAEIADALGDETGIGSAPDALAAIAAEVPFYAGLTPTRSAARGVRWQEREAAAAFPRDGPLRHLEHDAPAHDARRGGAAPWAPTATSGPARSPSATRRCSSSSPTQRVEIAPADAERLGLTNGDEVEVRSNGTSVSARVALRDRIRPGAAFLIEGTEETRTATAEPSARTAAPATRHARIESRR